MSGSFWFPKRSDTEMRRITAETLYDLEMECRRQGWGADPALVYDEERDLFRFRDGKFAFSREHVNLGLLRKRGLLRGDGVGGRGSQRRARHEPISAFGTPGRGYPYEELRPLP